MTEVPTRLYTQASEQVEKEISEEIKIPDPTEAADLRGYCSNSGCDHDPPGEEV